MRVEVHTRHFLDSSRLMTSYRTTENKIQYITPKTIHYFFVHTTKVQKQSEIRGKPGFSHNNILRNM